METLLKRTKKNVNIRSESSDDINVGSNVVVDAVNQNFVDKVGDDASISGMVNEVAIHKDENLNLKQKMKLKTKFYPKLELKPKLEMEKKPKLKMESNLI